MGQFTTQAADTKLSFTIIKYVLLFLIVANIGSTIWIGIYNKRAVDKAEELYPGDRWTGDKGLGESAKVWEKLCITFLVLENVINLLGLFATIQEHYGLSIAYSILMFAAALYGAGAKYVRGSVCSYLMPFIVAVFAAIFSHQIRMDNYRLDNDIENNRDQEEVIETKKPLVMASVKSSPEQLLAQTLTANKPILKPKPSPLQTTKPSYPSSSSATQSSSTQSQSSTPSPNGKKSSINGSVTEV